ncbi:MAG TPA: Gfo/Idh/MocA family oxidoreductase [Acidimicrobiales bacterium]
MQDAPVRVAVIGYGLGGSVFHAPLVSVTPRLSLAAIVTSNPERAAAAQARYPHVRVVPTVDDLLSTGGDVDLAVVTVPNAVHEAVAEAALRSGLSVVVDKPVAPTSTGVEAMARLGAANGLHVIPFHNRRWDGDYRTVAEIVRSGRVGRVWRIESRFERWKPTSSGGPAWKRDPSQAGGGVLYDLGSHLIDQILALFGWPSAVYAELAGRDGPVDDDAFVALTFASGLVVHLWASTKAAALGPRFRVLGSEGAYVKYGLDVQEDALRAGRVPTEPGWGEEAPSAWGRIGTPQETQPVPTLAGAYQEFYGGVAACLLDGAEPPVRIEDAVAGLRIIEAAERSARTGTTTGLSAVRLA